MKFSMVFKTPDVLDQLENSDKSFAKQFMKDDEIIVIEFDTYDGTAIVVPQEAKIKTYT